MNESLRLKTAANLSYNLLCRVLVFALSAATGIILARNLTSSDYGIVGFAMIFISFLRQFSDLGISSSIIRKESIDEDDLYTVFTLKILLSAIAFLASFAWGALSQMAFDIPAVKPVIIVLAVGLLLDSPGFLPTTVLTRELKFKRLTVPQIGSQLTASVVAITTVYLGFRYWSIVFSNLSATIAGAAIVFALRPVPLKLRWNPQVGKEHLKFGSQLFFAGLMIFVLFNADNFVVGAVGGAATLGFYSIAFNWSTKATGFISQAVHNILLSTFSRVQRDAERLKRGYLTILEYVSFAAILANILLLIVSRELLVLVLGAGTGKWLPAMVALDILCVYGIVRALLEPVGNMIVAVGKPALILKSNTIVAALQVGCLYPAFRYFGIAGVAALVVISYSVQFLVYFPTLHRELSLSFTAVVRSVRPAVLSGGALAAFGFVLDRFLGTSWLSLAVKLLLGASLYIIIYNLMTKWKIVKEAREIIGAVLAKPNQSPV